MADTDLMGPRLVPIDNIHPSANNPRRITERDLERLKRSLSDDPDFMRLRPILARPDGSIYAGNMRFEAAKALGLREVWVVITDDPETVIRQRAIKDNSQFGEWVEEELGEFIQDLKESVPDLDFGALGLDDNVVRTMGMEAEAGLSELRYADSPDVEPGTKVGGVERAYPVEEDSNINAMAAASPELKGALKLAEDVVYEGADAEPRYDIPIFRPDRFVDELPPGLETWGGGDAGQDADFYLYNYSPHKTTQNAPLDRSILCFFTEDRFFLPWWNAPAYYVGKLMNAGVTMAVEPDFSVMTGSPKVVNLWYLYQAHWLGRYMQDAGIRLIPRIPYPWMDLDYMLAGFPTEAPVIALNCQTPGGGASNERKDQHVAALGEALERTLAIASPRQLLLYGAALGERVAEGAKTDADVVVLDNFLTVRRKAGLPYRES